MDRTWYWGNITAYNNWTYIYQGGRQLATASNSVEGKNLSFTYNDAGLRITQKVGSNTHYYTYNGSLLTSDVVKNASGVLQYAFYFRYDQNGAPIGFGYKSSSSAAIVEYYYLKNLQGDITGIVDTSGNRVATYVYDAWGKHLSIAGSNTDLANKNPLRYRGYVYDTESSLYYLQSRYYSPAIGRFISADSYAMTYETPTGANMFAYCLNNPIASIDYDGSMAQVITQGVIVSYWISKISGLVAVFGTVVGPALVGGLIVATVVLVSISVVEGIQNNVQEASKKEEADPYARPGQKKQGRERKSKARQGDNWEPRSKPKPPKKHTPGRDHRKRR